MGGERWRVWRDRLLSRFDAIILLRLGLEVLVLPTAIVLVLTGGFRPGHLPMVTVAIGLVGALLVHDLAVRRLSPARLTATSYAVVMAMVLFGTASSTLVVAFGTLVAGVMTPVVMATVVSSRQLGLMMVAIAVAAGAVLYAQGDPPGTLALACPAVTALMASPGLVTYVYRLNLERAVRPARELARADHLTGLLNRRGLAEEAPRLLGTARRTGGMVGVLVADVDHFKRVNDRHGHVAGDEVLKLVAATVMAAVRPGDLVVRLGGEELAVVAMTTSEGIIALAERIRHAVQEAGRDWGVTVSVGVSWARPGDPRREDHAELVHTLIDRADELMYDAKRAGRNRVRLPA